MKQNLYFQTLIRRGNILQTMLYDAFLRLASYPRLLLEVFIRKNFGRRYFSMASVITVAIIAILLPIFFGLRLSEEDRQTIEEYNISMAYLKCQYLLQRCVLWYLFVVAFLVFSFFRWKEVAKTFSGRDENKFSLYTGDINPIFFKIKIFGKQPSVRTIETVIEPTLFFLIGLVLLLLKQNLGLLLIISSVFYAVSYMAAYKMGDDFVMDKIDEMIMNEELENAFVHDLSPDKTRGVKFHMKKPKDIEMRRKLAQEFMQDEDKPATVS